MANDKKQSELQTQTKDQQKPPAQKYEPLERKFKRVHTCDGEACSIKNKE